MAYWVSTVVQMSLGQSVADNRDGIVAWIAKATPRSITSSTARTVVQRRRGAPASPTASSSYKAWCG